ncbi:MAG: LysR family transcriptional regulator [Deltaproteobacteria bacterium]|nr:LysR family transcriptional regulator [Deltaproteobacteria bacterium]
MKISLRELEYLVAVADHRHFGKAARVVSVSQPTLSMQLKKLEADVGGKLIERLPREAILTSLGEEVLPFAREILRLAAEMESRGKAGGKHSRLRLGVIPSISPYLLPRINLSLSKGIQGQKLSLIEAQTAELVRLVKDGSIDVAILSTPLKERGLEEISIYSEPFYVAVSDAHPLSRRQTLSTRDLKGEKLLLLGEGHCLRNQTLSLCKLSQGTADADLTATSIETLRSMVATGAGITLVPQLAIRKGDGVSYVPLTEDVAARSVGLIYRPSFVDTSIVEMLASVIRSAAQREKLKIVG